MMNWVEIPDVGRRARRLANLRRRRTRRPWRPEILRRRNESWGCGGATCVPNTTPTSNRRYNTFVKNYGGNKIYRIACGANDADYNWTEV
jgi:alpha-N-arabinofuranosidase